MKLHSFSRIPHCLVAFRMESHGRDGSLNWLQKVAGTARLLEDQIFGLLQIFIQLENQLIRALQVLLVPRQTLGLVPASWGGPWGPGEGLEKGICFWQPWIKLGGEPPYC